MQCFKDVNVDETTISLSHLHLHGHARPHRTFTKPDQPLDSTIPIINTRLHLFFIPTSLTNLINLLLSTFSIHPPTKHTPFITHFIYTNPCLSYPTIPITVPTTIPKSLSSKPIAFNPFINPHAYMVIVHTHFSHYP